MAEAIQREKFDSVQVLRAVAALLVVCLHSAALLHDQGLSPAFGSAVSYWGNSGVDIFFILSGLLMVLTTSRKEPGLQAARAFMAARLKRIVPLYWILTAAVVAILLLAPSVFNRQKFEIGNAVASFLFLPTVNPIGQPYPILYVGWTLAYEMFFYVVFAALLLVTRRMIVPVMAALFATLVIAGQFTGGNVVAHTYTEPLLLEFIFGAAVGTVYLTRARLPAWACLMLIAGAIALAFGLDGHGLHRAVRYGLPALLLVSGCLFLERAGRWPHMSLLRAIGDSSYSLYLTHIFVIPVAGRVLLKVPAVKAAVPPDAVFVAIVAVAAVAGHMVYLAIERPIQQRLAGRRSEKSNDLSAVQAAVVAAGPGQ